jgi:Zn ribbon nucleic-acid-binding protein
MSECPDCGGASRLTGDNGAKYPETRVEFWKCTACGHKFTQILKP